MIFSGVLIVRTTQGESRHDMEQLIRRIINTSRLCDDIAVVQIHFENGVPEETDKV